MSNLRRGGDDVWSVDDLEIELRMLPGVRAAGFEQSDDMLFVQLHVAGDDGRVERALASDQPMPVSASRIAARHSDRPVAVEVVRWRDTPPIPAPAPRPQVVPAPGEQVAAPAEAPIEPSGERAGAEPEAEVEMDVEVEVEPASPPTAAAPTVEAARRARLLAVLAFPDTDELEVHLVHDGKRTIGRAAASDGVEGAALATLDAIRDLGSGVTAELLWARSLDDPTGGERVVVAVALEHVDPRTAVNYGVAGGASPIDAAARAVLDALDRRLSRPS